MTEAGRDAPASRFYEAVLDDAERAALSSALQVEGVDEEIAALRLRLRTVLDTKSGDMALMLRGMDVLRRMVATRYGLTKQDEEAFRSAFASETLRRMQERGEGGGAHDVA